MPDVLPHSVIYGLPVMTFRGLLAPPYDVAGFGFSHSHGKRRHPYFNGAAHDWTGLDEQQLPFTLYFLNTLEPDAFPDAWNEWWTELQNGEPGEMVHPLLGTRQVVVRSGDVQLTAKSTAGVVVSVEFSTTVLDPDEEQKFAPVKVNVAELAAKAVAEINNAEIILPSEESAVSLLDAVDMISGLFYQMDLAMVGVINQAQSIVENILDFITGLGQHNHYKAVDALVTLWAGLKDMGKQIGVQQARAVGSALLTRDTPLDVFARDRGNSLSDVIGLNPSALEFPVVPKGAMLKYYL